MANKTDKVIDQTIQKNLGKLRKRGVLTVRPGFEIAKHQLTGRSAIVATVHTKKKSLPKGDMLPNSISGIPVDVREASPFQRLCAHNWPAAAVTQVFGRPENTEPTWPFEREMPSGKLLKQLWSMTPKALAKSTASQPAMQSALAAHAKKTPLKYKPASNTPLNPVTTTTTITACVSPDAALSTLENFLTGTSKSLVLGMYDFTSGPILKDFQDILKKPKTLQMVLDNALPPNETANQTDPVTVEDLRKSLGSRAKIAWALVRSDAFASAWMFPYAYHIKVIVRDGTSFWLSSGNLNNSNEPDLGSPPSHEDRDWHVIIEDPQLAGIFGAYLNQDFVSAAANQASSPSATSGAVSDANMQLALDTNPPEPPAMASSGKGVAAKTFINVPVTITPLLTPDTLPNSTKGQYLTTMTKFISNAKKTLFIQLQYIEASKGTGDYDALLQTIADRVKAGVDVRLIEDQTNGEKWAEKMKKSGVDLTANIRLQPSPNVHNKGFVIDSSIVVVSSQNFSPSGVQTNRDAGVIIESPVIAQYFEPIFLSDWNRLKPFAPKDAAALAAKAKKRTPAKPKNTIRRRKP
jgi:PLD-like domain